MKYKLLILIVLLFGGHCFNLYRQSDIAIPEVETFEIKDKLQVIHIYLVKNPI